VYSDVARALVSLKPLSRSGVLTALERLAADIEALQAQEWSAFGLVCDELSQDSELLESFLTLVLPTQQLPVDKLVRHFDVVGQFFC
jgi:hypothetical protein